MSPTFKKLISYLKFIITFYYIFWKRRSLFDQIIENIKFRMAIIHFCLEIIT